MAGTLSKALLAVVLSLMTAAIGHGSTELTIREAVEEGLKGSPDVEDTDAILEHAKWQHVAARAGLLPKFDIFASHSFDTQYETLPFSAGPISAEVPIAFPRTAYGLEKNWVLFDGLASWNLSSASSSMQAAADSQTKRRRFEVRKGIEIQYFSVLEAIQMSEVANKNLNTVQDSLAISEARLRNGVSTAPDVLRVQVQETEALAEMQRTTDTIAIQREKLRQVMGMQADARQVNGDLPIPSRKELVMNLRLPSLEARDDIRALQMEVEAADQERRAAIGSFLPAVALTGHVENYDNTDYALTGHDGSFRNAYDIGLSFKWRVLDGGETLAKPGLAQANRMLAQSHLRQTMLRVPTNFELWKRRYIYSSDLYEARTRDVKRAEESLRIIKLSFQQGRRIINEVLDAETDLFRSRAGAVQAKFEAIEAMNQLELVIGKDLL